MSTVIPTLYNKRGCTVCTVYKIRVQRVQQYVPTLFVDNNGTEGGY